MAIQNETFQSKNTITNEEYLVKFGRDITLDLLSGFTFEESPDFNERIIMDMVFDEFIAASFTFQSKN